MLWRTAGSFRPGWAIVRKRREEKRIEEKRREEKRREEKRRRSKPVVL